MGVTVKRLKVDYDADVQKLKSKLDQMNRSMRDSNGEVKKAQNAFSGMWKQILAGGVAFAAARRGFQEMTDFMRDSIRLGSEAAETHSKFGVVFSKVMNQASGAVETLTKNYGQSKLAAETMLSSSGDLLTGLGMSQQATIQLSEATARLSVDLASFTNYAGGARGANEALVKAMLGEREMIKSLGIVITEEMVKEKLLAEGKEKLTGLALKQAKAEATLKLALDQSKNAIGDYARTQDSWANQMRQLENVIEDIKVEIGQAFIETALPALRDFSSWVRENKDTIIAVFEAMIETVKDLVGWVVKAVNVVKELFDPSAIRVYTEEQKKFVEAMGREAILKPWEGFSGMMKQIKTAINQVTITTEKQTEKTEKLNEALTKVVETGSKYIDSIADSSTLSTYTNTMSNSFETLRFNIAESTVAQEMWAQKTDQASRSGLGFNQIIFRMAEAYQEANNREKAFWSSTIQTADGVGKLASAFIGLADAMGISHEALDVLSTTLNSVLSGLQSAAQGDIAGTAAAAITSFTAQLEAAVTAFIDDISAKTTEDWLEEWNELVDSVEAGSKEIYDFIQTVKEEGIVLDEIVQYQQGKINEGLAALGDYYAWAATSQERFNRAQVYTMAIFGGLIASGYTFVDAIRAMQDEFTTLIDLIEKTGFAADESFQFLLNIVDFINQHEELANALSAVEQMLTSAFESGAYSITQLQGLISTAGADITDMFNTAIAQGATKEEAYALISSAMNDLLVYANEYGLKLDEQTQALVAQMQAAGYLTELQIPEDVKQTMLLEEMLKIMGGTIPYLLETINDTILGTAHAEGDGNTNYKQPDINKYAIGGDFLANKRQLISVGEVPERVQITPLSQIENNRNDNSMNINITNEAGDSALDIANKLEWARRYNLKRARDW